jgi:DNA-binding NarL/FixJ family response regulator
MAIVNPRVLIIDGHLLFSDVIRVTLERDLGADVLGPVTNGDEGLRAALAERPDVILVDLSLPDRSGLEVGEEIARELPEARVVAVTSLSDPSSARRAYRAGFHGFLPKSVRMHEFTRAIRAILDNGANGGRGPRARLDTPGIGDPSKNGTFLTPREREVLELLAEGLDNAEISRRLEISRYTLKTHVHHLLTKLHAHSRHQAVARAIRQGILPTRRR